MFNFILSKISLKKIRLLGVFSILVFFLFVLQGKNNLFFFKAVAQNNSSDAIAVRVIPNPNHLSAQNWYQLQGFSGSPQSLLVDGYKAVRDGRTVYVAATNIVFSSNKTDLYTNIYLISYDQQADQGTVDAFGRILKNWKFNNNLDQNQVIGRCSISNKSCQSTQDCPEGYICANSLSSPQRANKCVIEDLEPENLNDTPYCSLDSECPNNLFCDGLKARIIRDLDRLEKIVFLKEHLKHYQQVHGHYPILGAGTYLPHVAVSTWPSWQNAFLSQVGATGITDPVNKLGSCLDSDGNYAYDLNTCWNAVHNIFFGGNYTNFALPVGSQAMAYVSDPKGSDYKMCANMESPNFTITDGTLSNHTCSLTSIGNIGLSGTQENNAPIITEYFLKGISGQEFEGYIKAMDPENHDIIFWDLESTGNYSSWFNGQAPVLQNTNNPNQKKVYSPQAGDPGSYNVKIVIKDSLDGKNKLDTQIIIENPEPQIIIGDVHYNLSSNSAFYMEGIVDFINSSVASSQIEICEFNLNQNSCSSAWVKIDNAFQFFSNNLKIKKENLTNNKCLIKIEGNDSGNTAPSGLPAQGAISYQIRAKDAYNSIATAIFSITVTADPPFIDLFNCPKITNLGDDYFCSLRTSNSQEEATFSVNLGTSNPPLPKELYFSDEDTQLRGKVLAPPGIYPINISVKNKFNKTSSSSFDLLINSNCGKSLVKYPGGPWNYNGTIRDHSGFYKTVLVGNQCWLQDNLNIGIRKAIGDEIKGTLGASSDPNLVEKYCYGDKDINCDLYGGLYTWNAALSLGWTCNNSSAPGCSSFSSRGICPPGWRVPTDYDWYILEKYLSNPANSCDPLRGRTVGACANAGKELKKTGSSAFNAIKALSHDPLGADSALGSNFTAFWSLKKGNTTSTLNKSFARKIYFNSPSSDLVFRNLVENKNGNSLRCIKDFNYYYCHEDSDCSFLGPSIVCDDNLCINSLSNSPAISPQID